MRQLLSDCWTLDLPDEWHAQTDEDAVIVTDDDNISTIELSAMRKEQGEVTGEDLAQFAAELNDSNLPRKDASLGDFAGYCYQYVSDGEWCRDWFLSCKDVFLLVTYTCLEEDKALDDAAVDYILDSLNYLPEGALNASEST